MEISLVSAYMLKDASTITDRWLKMIPMICYISLLNCQRNVITTQSSARSSELFSPTSAGDFELFMMADLIHVPWIDRIISMNRLAQYSFTQVKQMVLHVSVLLICVPLLSLLIWHTCLSWSNGFNYVPFFWHDFLLIAYGS